MFAELLVKNKGLKHVTTPPVVNDPAKRKGGLQTAMETAMDNRRKYFAPSKSVSTSSQSNNEWNG